MRVDHQFDVGADAATGRFDPADAVRDRKPVAPDHAHLDGGEALGGIASEFRLCLVARRPAAAGIAAHGPAHRTQCLIQWYAERLGLDVPDGDIDAGDGFHDHAAPPAFIGLGDAALQGRFGAGSVVHLLVDTFGEHRVLSNAFRREFMVDDGRDDRRRTQRRADPDQPVIGLDTNEGCVALDLGPEIGAVALVLGHWRRHWNGGDFDDFHWFVLPWPVCCITRSCLMFRGSRGLCAHAMMVHAGLC